MGCMKEHTRRAVAYIGTRMVTGKAYVCMYDPHANCRFAIYGELTRESISLWDHSLRCAVTGLRNGGSADIFHYGNKAGIRIEVEDDEYKGVDEDSGVSFNGSCGGNSTMLFCSDGIVRPYALHDRFPRSRPAPRPGFWPRVSRICSRTLDYLAPPSYLRQSWGRWPD
jgi:hypothetical protein